MAVTRTGEWARARQFLSAGPVRLHAAIRVAVRQEAHALRNEIVRGLTSQSPGGRALQAPSPLTIAARQLAGFGGTKALLVRGDLRNSVSVIADGDEAFIGIQRSARSKDGASLVNVAELQEYGGPPTVIRVTPRMRRFLFALVKRAGKPSSGGSGRNVVVVQVPARPFLRPAFEKFRHGVGRRFLARVAHQLGLGGPV